MQTMRITDLFDEVYNDVWSYGWQLVPTKFKYKQTIYHMTDDGGAFTGYEDNKGRNFLDKITARDCLNGTIKVLERIEW